jgi:hypothetical protein
MHLALLQDLPNSSAAFSISKRANALSTDEWSSQGDRMLLCLARR